MRNIFCLFLMAALLTVGCGGSEAPKQNKAADNKAAAENVLSTAEKNIVDKNTGEVDYEKLRQKAKVAEAATVVGYDGKAIKKQLDKVIDDNEKMHKQMQELDL